MKCVFDFICCGSLSSTVIWSCSIQYSCSVLQFLVKGGEKDISCGGEVTFCL